MPSSVQRCTSGVISLRVKRGPLPPTHSVPFGPIEIFGRRRSAVDHLLESGIQMSARRTPTGRHLRRQRLDQPSAFLKRLDGPGELLPGDRCGAYFPSGRCRVPSAARFIPVHTAQFLPTHYIRQNLTDLIS